MGIKFCVSCLCLLIHFIFKTSWFARLVGKHIHNIDILFILIVT